MTYGAFWVIIYYILQEKIPGVFNILKGEKVQVNNV